MKYATWIFVFLLLLNLAAGCGQSPEKARKTLTDRGIDFTVDSFMKSVFRGKTEEVELFLLAGMDPEEQTKQGDIALFVATAMGHMEIINLLVKHGADISATSQREMVKGCTALHFAIEPEFGEIVTILIRAGADVNTGNKKGQTPLYWAIERGHLDLVKQLLSNGADGNMDTVNGWTPLHVAADHGNDEAVDLLLGSGAEVNAKIKGPENPEDTAVLPGMTPLHLACAKGHISVVRKLIAQGADVNARSFLGKTPLHTAQAAQHDKIIEILRKHSD